jgi:hypothetical protein
MVLFFYLLQMLFPVIGIYAFGRPYEPLLVPLVGLAVFIVAVIKAPAFTDWLDKIIFLCSFTVFQI